MNISDKVSASSRQNASLNRDSELNPPDFDPAMGGDFGMSDDFGFGDDSFGSGDSFGGGFGNDSFGGGSFDGGFGGDSFGGGSFGGGFGGDSFGGGSFGGGFGGDSFGGGSFGGNDFGAPQTQTQSAKPTEDQVFEVMSKAAKSTSDIVKASVAARKTFDVTKKMGMGKQLIVSSTITAVVGLVLTICKQSLGLPFLVGGLFGTGTGIIQFMFAYSKKDNVPAITAQPEPESLPDNFSFASEQSTEDPADDWGDADWGDTGWDDVEVAPDVSSDSTQNDFAAFDAMDNDLYSMHADLDTVNTASQITHDELLDTLTINNGMVTRQYLYEHVLPALESINPRYDYVKELDENSDDFANWAAILEDCAGALRSNDTLKMPQLLGVKEKLFSYVLTVKREKWCKTDALVDEIVNFVGYDESTGKVEEGVYGSGHDAAGKSFITIMKGETAIVSVRDIMERKKEFFLDIKNGFPITLGIDSEGEPMLVDFKQIEALLVCGMPRSGKSWALKSMLAQIMMFNKPADVQFLFLDPKGSISDFKSITTPHVLNFVSTDESILRALRYIVNDFAAKRKDLIGNCPNGKVYHSVADYKKDFPDADLPLVYVVIDEIMTLADRMDKDTKEEFQGLISILVSQLPALSIRIFMVPHVVKDQIVKKRITQLIPCRISVRGNAEHIEDTLGVRNFAYKLAHVGDMAVALNNASPRFVHSSILTQSNEAYDNVFNFLDKMWRKIDPESVRLAEQAQKAIAPKIASSSASQTIPNSRNVATKSAVLNSAPSNNTKPTSSSYTSTSQKSIFEDVPPDDFYGDTSDNINIWGDDD